MSGEEQLRRLRSEIETWGFYTAHELPGSEIIYAESRNGSGLPIEMIVADGCITFISLGEYFWADYAASDVVQTEALGIIELVVCGGAAIIRGKHGCQLLCGTLQLDRSAKEKVLRQWSPWRPPSRVYASISLPIKC